MIDWNHVLYRAWQVCVVLAIVLLVACIQGFIGQ